jgi:putative DNA primase/helicase
MLDNHADEITEDSVALQFTDKYVGRLLFDHDAGRWFKWDGNRWAADGTGLAYNYAREVAREAANSTKPGAAKSTRSAAFARGVERMAQCDRAHAVTAETWDRDLFLLGTPGATIDLRSGLARKPNPDDRITKLTAATPGGDCPLWMQFLDEATGGDMEVQRFLQQWAGYSLTGSTAAHALLFLHGPGGNGKSVFLDALTHVLGDYAATAPMETFTASKGERHSTEIAMLRGARLVTASETEEGRAWAEAKIKALTGGDLITARFMRQDNFTFRPQFKLTIVGNHRPVLRNVDDAMRRRFNVVPFDKTPDRPDPDLPEKLRFEAGGILQWAIEGCLDWQANQLVRPESVKAATEDYFAEQDVLQHWLDEACRVEPGNAHLSATPTELFRSWAAFAEAAGERPGTQKRLAEALTRRGLQSSKQRIGGKVSRAWLGIEVHRPDISEWQERHP